MPLHYVIVFEQTPNHWSAYVPDVPGCIAAADTREEVEQLIREGIALYIESLQEDGEPVPQPRTWTGMVELDLEPTSGAA